MAEKVIIDIELKGLGDAKKGLDDLTKQQIAQRDEIKQTTAEIKEYEKELASLRKEQEAGGQLTDEQIAREQELTANIQTSKVELASQKDELSSLNAERRAAVKEVDQYNTALNAELGSNEQLKAQLGILTKEYNSLSQEQRENTEEGQQLTQQIDGITDKLKENESAVGDNRRNVGNYSESIQGALGNVKIFGVNLGSLTKSFQQTKDSTLAYIKALVVTEGVQKSQTAATNSQTAAQKALNIATLAGKVAMNVFKLALIATGIGAFVVIVGSLVAYFKSTEEGAMKLKVIMAALGSVTDNIRSKFADFGKIIFDSFNSIKELKISDIFKSIGDSIKENITNRIEAFGLAGKAIAKIFSGDIKEGFKDLANSVAQGMTGIEDPIGKVQAAGEKVVQLYEDGKEAVKGFYAEVLDDAAEAAALQEKENALVFQRRKLLKDNAILEGEIAQLRADAADKANLTQDEIIAKLEEAKQKETEKLKNLTAIAQAEKDIQAGRSALATDNADEAEELAQKEIALLQAQANEKSGIVRLEKQIAAEKYTLQRENLAAELKLIQAQGGDTVATLIEIENNKREAQLAETSLSEKERQAIIAESENKIADLKLKGLEEEEQNRKEALENELADLDYQQFRELEQANLTAEERLAIDRKYQKEKAQLELESLTNQATLIKAQLEQITADTGQGLIPPLTPEEEALLKKQLNEINTQMLTIGQTINGIDEEEAGLNLLNGLGLDEAGMEKLNFAMQTVSSSISSIGSLMASITERNKKVIQEQVEAGVISQEQADKKLEQIERKAFKRQKAIQIATATANAAQGVLAALAQTTDVTPTQSLRVANAAMIGILGAIQVATVAAQKFQDGGLIQGASHSQGGVPFSVAGRGGFEAEGGEYIVKKSTVDNYGVDFMNALNNMRIPKMFAEGGYVAPTPVGTISDQVSRGVSELVSVSENRQLQVINVEQDFTKLQTKVSNVEQARTY
jgi:polyhydroxyalkanoate synthesis regulator phasin